MLGVPSQEMRNRINAAIEQVSDTKTEHHAPIEGLPNHYLLVRPQEPDVVYILDLRDLKQVKTILLRKVSS